jgi:hypothetical protein
VAEETEHGCYLGFVSGLKKFWSQQVERARHDLKKIEAKR